MRHDDNWHDSLKSENYKRPHWDPTRLCMSLASWAPISTTTTPNCTRFLGLNTGLEYGPTRKPVIRSPIELVMNCKKADRIYDNINIVELQYGG